MAPHHEPPNNGATEPEDGQARTKALYLQHWKYVRSILPFYGIPSDAQRDLSQSVWLTVQERIASYDPEIHQTPRAWLTGIVRRCAANDRRARKRRAEVLTGDLSALAFAPGLDPEQAAFLRRLHQVVPDPDRREALILQVQHGLSIKEIAAATGATESAVEWRIRMAKKELKGDDDANPRGAFLGFGSVEALMEALRPKPLPDEHGAEEWNEISRRIKAGDKPTVDDSEPPPSTPPPPSAVPASTPSTTVATTIGKGTVGGLVALAFLVGALSGGLLARRASERSANVLTDEQCAGSATVAAEPRDTAPASSSTSTRATPTSSTSTKATPTSSTSTRATPTSSTSTDGATRGASLRLILQMRHAAETGNAAAVLALADEHARTFPHTDVAEREAERRKAMEQLRQHDTANRSAR